MATKMEQMKRSGGIPASALAPDAMPATGGTKLAAARGHVARGEDVVLPVFGTAYVQLLGHNQANQVEGETIAAVGRAGIPLQREFAWSVDLERKARQLAFAVRDPDDHAQPFGTVDEWLTWDDATIFACHMVYEDVAARLDPLGSPTLTPERMEAITVAFEKKNRIPLLFVGSAELVAWLLSGVVQLSSSPTPSSTSTESSPES